MCPITSKAEQTDDIIYANLIEKMKGLGIQTGSLASCTQNDSALIQYPYLLSVILHESIPFPNELFTPQLISHNPIETIKQFGSLLREYQNERSAAALFSLKNTHQKLSSPFTHSSQKITTDLTLNTILIATDNKMTIALIAWLTKSLEEFRATLNQEGACKKDCVTAYS